MVLLKEPHGLEPCSKTPEMENSCQHCTYRQRPSGGQTYSLCPPHCVRNSLAVEDQATVHRHAAHLQNAQHAFYTYQTKICKLHLSMASWCNPTWLVEQCASTTSMHPAISIYIPLLSQGTQVVEDPGHPFNSLAGPNLPIQH